MSIWARGGYSRARRGEGPRAKAPPSGAADDPHAKAPPSGAAEFPPKAPPSGAADLPQVSCSMANIKSQKKRIVRAERERLENRRYTSKIKTFFRRLETAVASGDGAQADAEHRELVQAIDKAVKRGALHRNSGARKKSRASRVRRG